MIQSLLLNTVKHHRMMLTDSERGEVFLPGDSDANWMQMDHYLEHMIGEDRAEEEDLCFSL